MNSARIRALLSELDALQSARARLFLHLDLLTDMCDLAAFVDTLADVATLHAKTDRSNRRRQEWRRLAEALHIIHLELND